MIWLIRHGETEWSLSGQHTGTTDVPLTANGEAQAKRLGERLAHHNFAAVRVSPLLRARRTCEIAGLGAQAVVDPDLMEWNYGAYEGLTSARIQRDRPGWEVFRDGPLHGESIEDVAVRARRVIAKASQAEGDVALFAHGHLLRILGACWIRLQPSVGGLLALSTASISLLGFERETPVIQSWNT
ncbi:MAG TPA: histidine phosphatase family protein [Bryobacteraceae bacterium]|nr:histidine phosphatase family protein [Bryobacteraceae bacterium]